MIATEIEPSLRALITRLVDGDADERPYLLALAVHAIGCEAGSHRGPCTCGGIAKEDGWHRQAAAALATDAGRDLAHAIWSFVGAVEEAIAMELLPPSVANALHARINAPALAPFRSWP